MSESKSFFDKVEENAHRGFRRAFHVETEHLADIRDSKVKTYLADIDEEIARLANYHDEGLQLPALTIARYQICKDYSTASKKNSLSERNKELETVKHRAEALAASAPKTVSDFIIKWNIVDDQRLKSGLIIRVVKEKLVENQPGYQGADLSYLNKPAVVLEDALAALKSAKTKDADAAADEFMAVYAQVRRFVEQFRDEHVAPPVAALTENAIAADPNGLDSKMKKLFPTLLEGKMADMEMTAWANGVDITMLSPAVGVALTEYTTGAFTDINGTLLHLPGKRSPKREADCRALAEIVTDALKQLEGFTAWPVIRGERTWPGSAAQYKSGNTFALAAFWSTGVGFKFDGAIQITITGLAKKSRGKNVSPFSKFPNEMEVLFPPGTKFRVKSNTPGRGDTIHVTLEEV